MLISCDVSYYQSKVDSSYPHPWLIIRGCDGDFLDPNASFNADWCRGAVIQGRMVGWTVYVVYRPGKIPATLENLATLGPLDRVMVDIESWGGQIAGDHSDEINSLILDLEAITGPGKAWRYGNRRDLASIHPRPLPGQLTAVAAYGPSKPTDVANLIGWQYTNGVENHTSNPSSSAPFGACDHNELYIDELSPSGGGVLEDDMGTLDDNDTNKAIIAQGFARLIAGDALGADFPNQLYNAPNPVNFVQWVGDMRGATADGIAALAAQQAQILAILTGTQVQHDPTGQPTVDLQPLIDAIHALPDELVAELASKLGATP